MNNKYLLSSVLIFAAGAATGAVASWYLLKTKYEQIAQEEIDSVKEAFAKRAAIEKPPLEEYAAKLNECGYNLTGETEDNSEEKEETESMEDDMAYVISAEEFGEYDEYESITLSYYADGVLTDEADEIIDDVEDIIGSDALTHFGEDPDDPDSVYVRNDRLKADYEILLDTRNYHDLY